MPDKDNKSNPYQPLEQQLDALMTKMNTHKGSASSEPDPTPLDNLTDTSEATAHDLGQQIQQLQNLLDQGAKSSATNSEHLEGRFEAPDDQMIDAAARANQDEPLHDLPTEPIEADLSIDQIDAMLAELASGNTEPEGLTEPLCGSNTPAEEPKGNFIAPEELLKNSVSTPTGLPVDPTPWEALASPTVEQPVPPGSYPKNESAFNTTATQAEQELVADTHHAPAAAVIQQPDAINSNLSPAGQTQRTRPTLRQVLAVINRPLDTFNPELRNTIGYVGLLTIGNAIFLLLFALLF